jgi:hypothetical protein
LNQKIVEAYKKIATESRTGSFDYSTDQAHRAVLFQGGRIVSARSDCNDDRLGEVMVRQGRITEEHLKDASIFVRHGKRLGEALAELGVIKHEEIPEVVRLQVQELAGAVLVKPPQRVSFKNLQDVQVVTDTPITVAEVIMAAARLTPDIERHVEEMLADDRRCVLNTEASSKLGDFKLSSEEAFILSRVDGQDPIRSVFTLSPLPEETTARALLGFLVSGIVTLEEQGGLVLSAADRLTA